MYVLYIVSCYNNSPRWYMEIFLLNVFVSNCLYLQLTPVLSNISFTYKKGDKGTLQQVTAFVKRT